MKQSTKSMLIILAIILILFNNLTSPSEKNPAIGIPIISEEYESVSFNYISQILADQKYIYILPDSQDGYVQVYNLDGEFIHAIHFYNDINGAFKIAKKNNSFYVRDKKGNIYEFKDNEFINYYTYEEAKAVVNLRDNTEFHTNFYIYKAGSIWKKDTNGTIRIIRFVPEFLFYIQAYGPQVILIIMIVYVVLLRIKQRNGNK